MNDIRDASKRFAVGQQYSSVVQRYGVKQISSKYLGECSSCELFIKCSRAQVACVSGRILSALFRCSPFSMWVRCSRRLVRGSAVKTKHSCAGQVSRHTSITANLCYAAVFLPNESDVQIHGLRCFMARTEVRLQHSDSSLRWLP